MGAWLDFSYLLGCDNHEIGLFVGGTKTSDQHKMHIDPSTGLPIIYALLGISKTSIMMYV